MKTSRNILIAVTLLLTPAIAVASGPVGIYGIIERVVLEPNDASPERIQIWGAFTFIDGGLGSSGATSKVQRGYLYFKLPSGNQATAAKVEWADLKKLAGSGEAVGFGNWGMIGRFDLLDSKAPGSTVLPYFLELYPGGGRQTDVRVRPAYDPAATPAVYSTNTGIVKLAQQGNRAETIRQLKEALKK